MFITNKKLRRKKVKRFCRLFLTFCVFLVFTCVGCDTGMQQNEKTDLVFSFKTPNFRSIQSIEDNPTLLIEACLVDYDGKTIQKTEKEISSGEALSFQFLKIATNINIKVKIQVFVKGDESPSYTGESDWILTQAGANKVSIMLQEIDTSIEVTFPSYNDPEKLITYYEESQTFTAKEGYNVYEWYIDGDLQETQTTNIFILSTDNMTGGIYTVMLIVTTESGEEYSAEYQVTIKK